LTTGGKSRATKGEKGSRGRGESVKVHVGNRAISLRAGTHAGVPKEGTQRNREHVKKEEIFGERLINGGNALEVVKKRGKSLEIER